MAGYPVITVSSFRQVSLYQVVMLERLVVGSSLSQRSALGMYLKYMKKRYFPILVNPWHVISFNSAGLISYVKHQITTGGKIDLDKQRTREKYYDDCCTNVWRVDYFVPASFICNGVYLTALCIAEPILHRRVG